MSKGYVPYLTLPDETIVTHTCPEDEKDILVYFEKPDEELFFKYLEINLSTLDILKNNGFELSEVAWFVNFCLSNYKLIVKYSKTGGILSA